MTDFRNELVRTINGFLTEIGITVRAAELDAATFLPGLTIKNGEILVDEAKLLYPGDLLHEAGHVAVTDADQRRTLDGTIHLPESEGGGYEMAAIAWSYAAALHLNLDPSVVFHDDGYKGDAATLRENFANGRYLGVPVLQWVGMTLEGDAASEADVAPYPHMLKWLR